MEIWQFEKGVPKKNDEVPFSQDKETKKCYVEELWDKDLRNEVENARKGKTSLVEKIDEIMDALGNDSNFAATIINLLSNKVDKTTANITYYVDSITGNDSNDGFTILTAFKTIQYAISKIPQTINNNVEIKIAPSIYNEKILVDGFNGKGKLSLIGGANISSDYIVSEIMINNCSLPVYIQGLKADTTISSAFNCSNTINIIFNYCSVDSISISEGFLFNNCFGTVSNCEVSNRFVGIYSKSSIVFSSDNSGSENTYGLLCQGGGSIGRNGTQPSWIITEMSGIGFQDKSIRIY